jgi:hypothetical protein
LWSSGVADCVTGATAEGAAASLTGAVSAEAVESQPASPASARALTAKPPCLISDIDTHLPIVAAFFGVGRESNWFLISYPETKVNNRVQRNFAANAKIKSVSGSPTPEQWVSF